MKNCRVAHKERLARDVAAVGYLPGGDGIDVPREEVDRHLVLAHVGEEEFGPVPAAGDGGTADLVQLAGRHAERGGQGEEKIE